jgi:hypothetical protein
VSRGSVAKTFLRSMVRRFLLEGGSREMSDHSGKASSVAGRGQGSPDVAIGTSASEREERATFVRAWALSPSAAAFGQGICLGYRASGSM